jgi:hypothetical protein
MTDKAIAACCWEQTVERLEKGNATQFCLGTTDGRISAKLIREPHGKFTLIVEEDENGIPEVRTFTEFKASPTADEIMLRRFPNHASYMLNREAIALLLGALAA